MNLFKNLFSHKDVEPVLDYKKAIVFVDYEHWYYSCRNLFHIAPDPISWRKNLDEKYNIERMYIFGDFSNKGIKKTRSESMRDWISYTPFPIQSSLPSSPAAGTKRI